MQKLFSKIFLDTEQKRISRLNHALHLTCCGKYSKCHLNIIKKRILCAY